MTQRIYQPNDHVELKPEWQDAGDHLFDWVVIEDRDTRILVAPIPKPDSGIKRQPIQHTHVIDKYMLVD